MPRLTFEISIPQDPTRQRVVIAGTDPALGNWNPERGLVLERGDDGKFRGACDLPYGMVEFKITRGSWETEESYADGAPCLNYSYLVAHDLSLAIEVEHWKDCPPVDPDLLYGHAIDTELDATQLAQHRRAVVWLPPGYMRSNDSRHPVLYLLDGQDSLAALNSPENETLEADSWVRMLSKSGAIPELILVAVFHSEDFGRRDEELSPQWEGPKMADFLVNDLKPFIDYTLCRDRTLRDPANTGVLGFGLGGTLALWMALRHAATFGRFACLSPTYEDLSADTPDECELVKTIASERDLKPAGHRIYFDHGTIGGEANIPLYQNKVLGLLKNRGFKEGTHFTVNIANGAAHSLTAWRARLGAPLTFLFGK
jgi:enterochelin esterase-like enzyme